MGACSHHHSSMSRRPVMVPAAAHKSRLTNAVRSSATTSSRGSLSDNLADRFGRTRETIAGVLKGDDFEALKRQVNGDMAQEARHAISTHRVKAARAWTRAVDVAAEKGDHKPAKDLLIHTDVIKPIGETTVCASS